MSTNSTQGEKEQKHKVSISRALQPRYDERHRHLSIGATNFQQFLTEPLPVRFLLPRVLCALGGRLVVRLLRGGSCPRWQSRAESGPSSTLPIWHFASTRSAITLQGGLYVTPMPCKRLRPPAESDPAALGRGVCTHAPRDATGRRMTARATHPVDDRPFFQPMRDATERIAP